MPGPLIRRQASNRNARPFMIIWEVTRACDLACRHCRAESVPDPDPRALTFEQGKTLLEQARAFGRPSPLFIFTGGDPFKRPDLFDLVRHGSEIGLMTAVSPSGTPLLNRANLEKLREAGARAISLSLDGSTALRHDDFRRVAGSFDLTLSGWRAARAIGLKVQVSTTVSRYNLSDLAALFRLVQELGAMTWSLFFLVPTGRARLEDEISPEESEAVMHFLYDVSKYISAKTTEGHHYKRVVLQRAVLDREGLPVESTFDLHPTYFRLRDALAGIVREKGLRPTAAVRRTPMHVNSGNGFVFVSHRGEVFPSGFMPIPAGNVRERSLVDIYRDSPLFRDLRDVSKLRGRCGRCEFAEVCGGSRSRAYAMTGDPLAEEPFCLYEPGSFPFQAEVAALLREDRRQLS